jgi:hypothetical protein
LTGCAGDRHLNGDWELGAGGGRLRTAPGGGAAPLTGLSGLRIDGDQATVLVQDSSGGFVPAIESLTLTTDDGRLTLMTPDDQIVTAYDDVLFTGAYWFNNGALVLELDDGAHIIFLPL